MTATIYSRSRGITIRCNWPGCECRYTTGLVRIRNHRNAAVSLGWIRGLHKRSTGSPVTGTGQASNAKWDICPEHAPLEHAEFVKRKAELDAKRIKRDEKRKIRDQMLKQALS